MAIGVERKIFEVDAESVQLGVLKDGETFFDEIILTQNKDKTQWFRLMGNASGLVSATQEKASLYVSEWSDRQRQDGGLLGMKKTRDNAEEALKKLDSPEGYELVLGVAANLSEESKISYPNDDLGIWRRLNQEGLEVHRVTAIRRVLDTERVA